MATGNILKRGTFGDIRIDTHGAARRVIRELDAPRLKAVGRWLARREARALQLLAPVHGVPRLVSVDRNRLIRSFLEGHALHQGPPPSREFFSSALRLLRQMHRCGIVHNDLAKEANWICLGNGEAGIVDFQLAAHFRRRGRLFRTLACEDLRHLLKHKRHYRPGSLTARELEILAHPQWPARIWRRLFKPCYHLVTRRILGWSERDGAEERQRPT
jgi:RIO-like serine/threonine protein kinase